MSGKCWRGWKHKSFLIRWDRLVDLLAWVLKETPVFIGSNASAEYTFGDYAGEYSEELAESQAELMVAKQIEIRLDLDAVDWIVTTFKVVNEPLTTKNLLVNLAFRLALKCFVG